jgi:hypothetical protein
MPEFLNCHRDNRMSLRRILLQAAALLALTGAMQLTWAVKVPI